MGVKHQPVREIVWLVKYYSIWPDEITNFQPSPQKSQGKASYRNNQVFIRDFEIAPFFFGGGGNQTMQMYGNFKVFAVTSVHCFWVDSVMTPV